MTIIQVPVLEKTFGVTIYVIDRANGQFYLVEGTKLMALNLYGFLDEQDWPDTPNIPTQAPIPSQGPQSTLTPITRVEDLQLRTEPDEGQATGNMSPHETYYISRNKNPCWISPIQSLKISIGKQSERNLQCLPWILRKQL